MRLAMVLFSVLTLAGHLVAVPPPTCTPISLAIGADSSYPEAYSCTSRSSEPYCLILVSDLACLQSKESNSQNTPQPPISLRRGEVVVWVGDYDPTSPSPCSHFSKCPKFSFQTFKKSPQNGLCKKEDGHHRPFGNKFDHDKRDGWFPPQRFEHLKATTVADDPTQEACYKHSIDIEKTLNSGKKGESIDPHIIIGGVGSFEILEKLLNLNSKQSGSSTNPGEAAKTGPSKP